MDKGHNVKSPSLRKGANRMTRHHVFERRFASSSHNHLAVRHLGAYSVGLTRAWHDRLHTVISPIDPAKKPVIDALVDIGLTYANHTDDIGRLERVVDDLVGFARYERPEIADSALEVATHIGANIGVLSLANSVRR